MCVRRLLFHARVETTRGRYDNFVLLRFNVFIFFSFFVARTIISMMFISILIDEEETMFKEVRRS